ncbi:MAG: glycosyltransferase family 2 protein [Anaerolineae bacterium]
MQSQAPEFSIVIPCLNEARTIATVIDKAQSALTRLQINGEIIVADNGSDDGSQALAERAGARVVHVPERGYGAALRGGIGAARGTYIIMGDADNSYDLNAIDGFVERLRAGDELVMGTRLRGTILPGAMPWLHQYLGNPVLTWLGNVLLGAQVSDYHCGLRGFRRECIEQLDLHTAGMEFASEMVAKASIYRLRISEVPITYYPDGRGRASHLRTWRDGWRHLKFLLTISPMWLYLVPTALLWSASMILFALGVDQLWSASLVILGVQALVIGILTRVFAITVKLLPKTPFWQGVIRWCGFDSALLISVSALSVIIGSWLVMGATISDTQRLISLTALTIALQILLAGFALSLLKIHHRFDDG